MTPVTALDWTRVLDWRCRAQLLHRPAEAADPVEVVRALAGVQAQVASSAEQAVAARQAVPDPAGVRAVVAGRRLVKTWAARGTLHLLDAAQAPAHLALLAAARTWEKPAWQRTFVTVEQLDRIRDVAWDALNGAVLSRAELTEAILDRTGDPSLVEHLTSGWGAVLKPLAWQGLLVYGPDDGARVTFTRPDTFLPGWAGLPEPDAAARVLIPVYLGAYGPASPATFDQWLSRGASRKAALRGWFADLLSDSVLAEVDVEGERLFARSADVAAMAAAEPFPDVRLLPAFDQFVLGPGTGDTRVVPVERRASVSRAAGWISPVVAYRGRVAGTWERTDAGISVDLFPEPFPGLGTVPADGIAAETDRLLN